MPEDAAKDLESLELFARCARDKLDSELWTEFLMRFEGTIRKFLRRTMRQALGFNGSSFEFSAGVWRDQEDDFFQSMIMKLVENDCKAMRRFVGATETDLAGYFAVIARSVVRDYFRRQRAQKRPGFEKQVALPDLDLARSNHPNLAEFSSPIEREVLARELTRICMKAIKNRSGEATERDRLIFQLYFRDGLSTAQIAAVESIQLSKQGVEKVLNRLKDWVRNVAASDSCEAVQ